MNVYPLHEHWFKTSDWILLRCDRMPRQTRFTISSRIAALAIEGLELIAEAIYSKEAQRRERLQRFNLVLEKLRILFRLCHNRNYVSHEQYAYISTEINTAGKMAGGWLKSSQTATHPYPSQEGINSP